MSEETAPLPPIDKTCIHGMQSPIRHLMEMHLGNSIFKISPERDNAFQASIGDFRLIYSGVRPWTFYANPAPDKKEVAVSRGAVELIWCSSLAHFLYYTRLIQGKNRKAATLLDPKSDPIVRNALFLLMWAIECQIKKDTDDNWPPRLPHPLPSPRKESDENVADELTLASCGFLFHHELAHIRLRHIGFTPKDLEDPKKRELCLAQEKEADIAAAEWVLDGIDQESSFFLKRILGITQALFVPIILGLYRRDSEGNSCPNLGGYSHPFSYDRLSSLLSRFLGTENHIAKGMAFSILDLHYQNSGRKMHRSTFEDPEEALEHLCNLLAKEFNT